MSRASLKTITAFLCAILAACGGGGADIPTTAANEQNGAPITGAPDNPSSPNPPSSPDSGSPGTPPTTPPSTPITASVAAAPADGATLSNTVRLEIRGSSIENAELLPPSGYSPRLGAFTVSADKTMAWLDFDSRTLPNGTLLTRISAFDKPAGAAGAREVVAMAPRQWQLRNEPPPAPDVILPASVMPEVHISNLNLPYVDPQPLVDMMQLADGPYEVLLRDEWPRVEGVMHQFLPANVILMPPTPMGFSGPWDSCISLHTRIACREAMNNMIGLMTSKQP